MQELEKKLNELELRLLKEVAESSKETQDIWVAFENVADLFSSLYKDLKSLRTDVDKLIENSCGSRKSA